MLRRPCPGKPWDPNLLPGEIRRSPRRALSWIYRRMTAPARGLPQVYIAGAKKGGTTSLFYYLLEHPRVLPPFRKEVKFFLYMYDLGLGWYRANFPFRRRLRTHVTLDATPSYLAHPTFGKQWRATNPTAKIIVLLRDPVARTLSHYFQNVHRGLEPLSLEEALEAEEQRLAGEVERILQDPCHDPWRYHRFGYLTESRYIEHLERLWPHVPPEQLLVLRSEDLFQNPAQTLAQVAAFLGLEPWQPREYKIYKKGAYDFAAVSPRVRENLRAYFRPYNQRLYAALGRDMGWEAAA